MACSDLEHSQFGRFSDLVANYRGARRSATGCILLKRTVILYLTGDPGGYSFDSLSLSLSLS